MNTNHNSLLLKAKIFTLLVITIVCFYPYLCRDAAADCNTPAANIRVDSSNPHEFIDANNQRFFWMGDTAWLFSTDELKCGASGCSSTSDFKTYVDIRCGQGFNVIQGNLYAFPEPDVTATNGYPGADQLPFGSSWNYSSPNASYWANVKDRIAYMNTQGIIPVIAPTWAAAINCCPSSGTCPDDCKRPNGTCNYNPHPWTGGSQIRSFYDWLGGASGLNNYNIVWLVSSNTGGSPVDNFANCSNPPTWSELAGKLGTAHLVTQEPDGGASSGYGVTYMQDQPCDDPTLTSIEYSLRIPVVNGEFNYEVTQACWDEKTTSYCVGSSNNSCWLGNFNDDTPCNASTCSQNTEKTCILPTGIVCGSSNSVCTCDANCGNGHHSGPEVVLYGAWSSVMRGGYFVYGNAATYTNFMDHVNCGPNSSYMTSFAAGYMTKLYNFFNNNNYYGDSSKEVYWNDPAFGPIGSIPTSDNKLALGIRGTQYVLFARSGGTFNFINDDPSPDTWGYKLYDIHGGTWGPAGTDSININHISVTADHVALVTKIKPVLCVPSDVLLTSNGTDYSGTTTCTLTGTPNNQVDVDCSVLPSGFSCDPQTVTIGSTGTVDVTNFTVHASFSTLGGTYPLTIRARYHQDNTLLGTFAELAQVPGLRCENFAALAELPTDWNFKDLGNWSVDPDGLQSPTSSKGTGLPCDNLNPDISLCKYSGTPPPPLNTTSIITRCTNCSIDTDIHAPEATGKVTLLGWYEGKGSRIQLVLNFNKNKIQLKQIHDGVYRAPGKSLVREDDGIYHVHLSYDGQRTFTAQVYGANDPFPGTTVTLTGQGVTAGLPGFRVAKNTSAVFSNIEMYYGGSATCAANDYCNCTVQNGPSIPVTGDEYTTNYGSPGSSQIAIDDVTVDEGTGSITYALVKVHIAPASPASFSIDYSTDGGTAVAGTDYIPRSQTVSIKPGQITKVLRIPIVGDSIFEPDATLFINVSNTSDGSVITRNQATLTIVDDDTPEDDEGIDDDFEIDCPSQFFVNRTNTRTMTCDLTMHDFLNINTDISWACLNGGTVQCPSFSSNNADELYVQIAPGTTDVQEFANFTIQGTVESDTRSDSLDLYVVDFQPTCPGSISVNRGHYTDSVCAVGYSVNWTDPTLQVGWSCSGLPTGASCAFTPNPWNVSWGPNVALRISTTAATPGGTYNITVTGTAGSQVRTIPVQLQVVTQQTYTFYPIADTYLTGNSQPNSNYGLATNLRLQQTPAYSHLVLKVSQQDLLNVLGTDQISSANLKLYVEANYKSWPANGAAVEVHRMTGSWQEYSYSIPPQGATWNCAVDANLSNSNPDCFTQWNGGSYSAGVLSNVIHGNNLLGWIAFDVKSDVQAIQNGSTHYGWLIRKRNWTDGGSVDYTSMQGGASFKPRLEVTVQY